MIDYFDKEVKVHQSLGDDPNTDNGMTADELKALFDRPVMDIKEYINNTLLPGIAAITPGETMDVYVTAARPNQNHCLWFKRGADGTCDLYYITASGEQIAIYLKPTDNTVTTSKIASNAVTTVKIADSAVTPAKLSKSYLPATENIILKSGTHYGTELPSAGTEGRLFFKKV